MKRATVIVLTIGAMVVALNACNIGSSKKSAEPPAKGEPIAKDPKVTHAVCVIGPFSKSKVQGVVRFVQEAKKVKITGKVTGLKPGKHGFHVHELGDISKSDGTSTGGHYNPTNKKHGKPSDKERHVGDLGNIRADDQGVAKIDMTDSVISLNGPHSIIGRSIIIHAKADDFSQPTGNAGARVGGGVIGIGKAK